jgi:hypothetical protein
MAWCSIKHRNSFIIHEQETLNSSVLYVCQSHFNLGVEVGDKYIISEKTTFGTWAAHLLLEQYNTLIFIFLLLTLEPCVGFGLLHYFIPGFSVFDKIHPVLHI